MNHAVGTAGLESGHGAAGRPPVECDIVADVIKIPGDKGAPSAAAQYRNPHTELPLSVLARFANRCHQYNMERAGDKPSSFHNRIDGPLSTIDTQFPWGL